MCNVIRCWCGAVATNHLVIADIKRCYKQPDVLLYRQAINIVHEPMGNRDSLVNSRINDEGSSRKYYSEAEVQFAEALNSSTSMCPPNIFNARRFGASFTLPRGSVPRRRAKNLIKLSSPYSTSQAKEWLQVNNNGNRKEQGEMNQLIRRCISKAQAQARATNHARSVTHSSLLSARLN